MIIKLNDQYDSGKHNLFQCWYGDLTGETYPLSCCLICYFLFEAIIITPINGFGTQWILDNKSQSISLSKKSNLLFQVAS